jgi:hypothetical protein
MSKDRRIDCGRLLWGAVATGATLIAALGCQGSIGMGGPPTTGNAGSTGGPMGGLGGGNGGTTVIPPTPCTTTVTLAPQRIIRLTLKQIANSTAAIDSTLTQTLIDQQGLATANLAFFPPLDSTREGDTIFADRFQQTDNMAITASKLVSASTANYTRLTKCTSTTDDACAQTYLAATAEKFYRRPLDMREKTSLTQTYTDLKTAGSTTMEGVQFGLEAILNAAEFLYRTEIGDATKKTADGIPLTPYETATQLAFFLSDGPPDQPLLDAAKQNQLASADQIGAQVDRLLATTPVQANLSFAMFVFFKLNLLDNVVIDPLKVPTTVFNNGVLDAMFTEGQKFLDNVLWHGNVDDIATSPSTYVNSDLATNIYQIPVPAGATQSNFVKVDLPATQRSGMLTLAPFITSRARTDLGSVVSRGLVVDETMMCQLIPPPPDNLSAQINAAKMNLGSQTPKQQAAVRDDPTVVCSGCHANFDPYGLVLENYDVVARYRTVDPAYGAVDATSFLPPRLGGGPVANAVDMAHQLAASGAFSSCMTKSVMQYALSTVNSPVDIGSCAVETTHRAFKAGSNQTFSSLVHQIAVSKTLTYRLGGT